MDETSNHLTRNIANFAANLQFSELPIEVVAILKNIALDTIGTTLAGTTLGDACFEVGELVKKAAGSDESTLIGKGFKIPALTAAFANGSAAHALNYDPLGSEGGHLGVSSIPSVLAAAEQKQGVNGKEMVASIAASAEITSRLAASITRAGKNANEKFLEGQLLGYFGAAIGAGRAFGLSSEKMQSAIGIALMQAAGSMQVVFEGDPPAKAIYGGFSNMGGMLAAQLASQGVGAGISAFEGRAGLFELFYDGVFDRKTLEDGLGSRWQVLKTQFKPWPTSANVSPYIESAISLYSKGLDLRKIKTVVAKASPSLRPWCEPLEERRFPPNPTSAANSIIYGIAKGLANGKVGLIDFTENGMRDDRASAVAELIVCEISEKFQNHYAIEVIMENGDIHQETINRVLGDPQRPLTQEHLREKFRECASHAAVSMTANQVDDLISTVESLELIEDVSELGTLLGNL